VRSELGVGESVLCVNVCDTEVMDHGCPSIHQKQETRTLESASLPPCRKAATSGIAALSYLIGCRSTSERAPSAQNSPCISTLLCENDFVTPNDRQLAQRPDTLSLFDQFTQIANMAAVQQAGAM